MKTVAITLALLGLVVGQNLAIQPSYETQVIYTPGDNNCEKGAQHFYSVWGRYNAGLLKNFNDTCLNADTLKPFENTGSAHHAYLRSDNNYTEVVPKFIPDTNYLLMVYYDGLDCDNDPIDAVEGFILNKCAQQWTAAESSFTHLFAKCNNAQSCSVKIYNATDCNVGSASGYEWKGTVGQCIDSGVGYAYKFIQAKTNSKGEPNYSVEEAVKYVKRSSYGLNDVAYFVEDDQCEGDFYSQSRLVGIYCWAPTEPEICTETSPLFKGEKVTVHANRKCTRQDGFKSFQRVKNYVSEGSISEKKVLRKQYFESGNCKPSTQFQEEIVDYGQMEERGDLICYDSMRTFANGTGILTQFFDMAEDLYECDEDLVWWEEYVPFTDLGECQSDGLYSHIYTIEEHGKARTVTLDLKEDYSITAA